jgi:hypothetical protein
MFVRQGVKQVLALTSSLYEPFALEQFESLGNSRDSFVERERNFRDTQLLLQKKRQHLQSSRITEGPKDPRRAHAHRFVGHYSGTRSMIVFATFPRRRHA